MNIKIALTTTIAFIMLSAGTAGAATLDLISRSSAISVSIITEPNDKPPYIFTSEEANRKSEGTSAFDESVSVSGGGLGAAQNSNVSSSGIHYQGALTYERSVYGYTYDAASTLTVIFDVAETSLFTMDWASALQRDEVTAYLWQSIYITKEGAAAQDYAFLFSHSVRSIGSPWDGPAGTLMNCPANLGECRDPYLFPRDNNSYSGTIEAGRYTLSISSMLHGAWPTDTYQNLGSTLNFNFEVEPVPVPASAWLLGSGLLGLLGITRKRRTV